jgi:hypothetical protein
MPDAFSLFPAAPAPQAPMNPLSLLDAAGKVNQLAQFSKEYQARQAAGAAFRGARRPDGSYDMNALSTGLNNPAVDWIAPEMAQRTTDLQRGQIGNVQAQYELNAKQQMQAIQAYGALADHPSAEGVSGVTAQLSAPGIPSVLLDPFIQKLRRATTPKQFQSAMDDLQAQAIGASGVSTLGAAPPGPEGQTQTQTLGTTLRGLHGAGAPGPAPAGGPMPTGLPPGTPEAMAIGKKGGAEAAAGLYSAANDAQGRQNTQLDLMLNDIKEARRVMGPTADFEKRFNVGANRILGFYPTMSKEEVTSLESLNKLTNTIALNQAGALHATDQTTRTAMGATPNSHMSGMGAEGMVNMLKGNNDAIITKADEWDKATRGEGPDGRKWKPEEHFQWDRQFNKQMDPRVFQFMRMDDKQRATLLKNVPDKANFWKKISEAEKRGWIELPAQHQALPPAPGLGR